MGVTHQVKEVEVAVAAWERGDDRLEGGHRPTKVPAHISGSVTNPSRRHLRGGRRPTPRRSTDSIKIGHDDPTLTGHAGLLLTGELDQLPDALRVLADQAGERLPLVRRAEGGGSPRVSAGYQTYGTKRYRTRTMYSS